MTQTARTPLSIAFVLPYGEPVDAFFPDTFLGMLCALARTEGHDAELLRVYYHGRDRAEDERIDDRFVGWLADREVDLLVFERVLDPRPVFRHRSEFPQAKSLVVCRGDSLDPVPGIDFAIGAIAAPTERGSRRASTAEAYVDAFRAFLDALVEGRDPRGIEGIATIAPTGFDGTALPEKRDDTTEVPLSVLDYDVIAPGETPTVIRKTLFGNSGCPYRADAMEALGLPPVAEGETLASKGCAFCFMGGDYERRPNEQVVRSLVAQAKHLTQDPGIEELVLSDQFSYPYLRELMLAAHDAGVRPGVRWLFAARCDAFLRTEGVVRDAVVAADECGYVLELYLSGFEAFCDADLTLYNKGITVDEQLRAVAAMRELAHEFPKAFDYKRARGHSLILWHPWTTPETLLETVDNLRGHGLMELFDEAGRNRLRLYDELPITRAAERDGATTDAWEDTEGGAGRAKGYNPENPWRFLDRRAQLAYSLACALRRRLGRTTELSQLRAAALFARDADAADLERPGTEAAIVESIMAALEALEDEVLRLCRPERREPPRVSRRHAAVVRFSGGCNNACPGCTNADEWMDPRPEATLARVREARRDGQPILLTGREPTIDPAFLDAVALARGDDERHVGVITNGRRFAYRRFALRTVAAGARAFSVKFFGPNAETADRWSRSPGGFEQAIAGIQNLKSIGPVRIEIRAILHEENLDVASEFVKLAADVGAAQIHVEFDIDGLSLGALERASIAVRGMARAAIDAGMPMDSSTVQAGSVRHRWVNS